MTWTTERLLLSSLLFLVIPSTIPSEEIKTPQKCDKELFLNSTLEGMYNISSPGYPEQLYNPGDSFSWCISTSDHFTVAMVCQEFNIPKSDGCKINALTVSPGDIEKSRAHCGSKPFREQSSSNQITVRLHSSKESQGGKFSCQVRAKEEATVSLRTVVYKNCDCGYSMKLRIVGGEETGINEFPFMVGLVDARRRLAVIVCGGAIISPRFILTADHCLAGLQENKTGVVVGEHDINTGSESSATKLIKAKRFIRYPFYNSETSRYDLGLVELSSPISYSSRVGPVCLPFLSKDWDLTGEFVTVLGWGSIFFGGPRSKVLKKADLNIVDAQDCINSYGSNFDANTQLCTYSETADACQYDSGGPLVYFNPVTNRYEIVGLVSYGRGCKSGYPGVNTYVAAFINFILDYTKSETYCFKNKE